jgi:TnpA family transposase
VTRRQQLTQVQIAALFDAPTEQRELVRHYTLSAADLAMIRRSRGDHNRLGQALMLCYLRYPGRPLKTGERPPGALLSFVAEQIDALPDVFDDYLAAERTASCHRTAGSAETLSIRHAFCDRTGHLAAAACD